MRALVALAWLTLASWGWGEIRTQDVPYQVEGTEHRGTLVYDDTAVGKPPGILVFPEWWGANDYAKSRAHMLVELGYAAFVADMYGGGKTTNDAKEAQTLAKSIYSDPEVLLKRANAALGAFKQTRKADNERLAATGYCMGGTVALNLARSGADLKAVVGFHCGLANLVGSRNFLRARVLVCNGADDKTISEQEQKAFAEEMREAKADWVYVLFGGAVHSFTNPESDQHKELGTVGYNAAADQRSWRLMRDFLAQALNHKPAAAAERGVGAQ